MTIAPRRLAVSWALLLAALLSACAGPPRQMPEAASARREETQPLFRLSPASLGRELAQQQQLTIRARGQTHRLDVLLEADAQAVRLAVIAMGQTAARLEWDGVTLVESRAAWWPAGIEGARILSDLQLMLWPASAIREALPPGWQLREAGDTRTLAGNGRDVAVVVRHGATRSTLENFRPGYGIEVESRSLGAAP